jgi:hypothetical protein
MNSIIIEIPLKVKKKIKNKAGYERFLVFLSFKYTTK